MIKILKLTVIIFFASLHFAVAQTNLKGQIIDDTGEPIPGVSVVLKGATSTAGLQSGTISNNDGYYELTVAPSEGILTMRFIGMRTKEMPFNGSGIYNVTMETVVIGLDEVVAIGYGVTKRSDLTGSVASLTAKDVGRTVSTTVDQVLAGKVAGVYVTQESGQPGGGLSVQIRGVNSITGSTQPLYVIDGMQISTEGSMASGATNPLSSINPADIVNIEVLKDASAAAIYGTQGANGVVIITTKRGKEGKTVVNYDTYYGLQEIANTVETMTLREYADYQNERTRIVGYGEREEFSDPSILGNGTNWQDELFNVASMYSHNISISGGTDKTNFLISAGYFNQDGIALGSKFDRISSKISVDHKAKEWLNVGANFLVSRSKENITTTNDNLIRYAIQQTPDVPVKYANGEWGGSLEENIYGAYSTNPVADALRNENKVKRTQLLGNGYIDIKIIKGLSIRNEFGANVNYGNQYKFIPTQDYGMYQTDVNQGTRSANNGLWWVFKNILNFERTFEEKHHVVAMVAHEAQESNWESLDGVRSNFPTDDIHELSAGDESSSIANSNSDRSTIESYFGRLNYSFDNRYLATFTLRADGSSKFGTENKWAYFPSAAFAWRFSNESYMERLSSVVSNGKLRLSWGKVGNQSGIPNYAYKALMTPSQTPTGVGYIAANIPTKNIAWESTESYNIGLDIGLFNNRIELIGEGYYKKTDDLIMQLPLSLYSGTSSNPGGLPGTIEQPYDNLAAIQNYGIEITLNTVNVKNSNFSWSSGITFSLNRNKVLKLYTESSGLPGKVEDKTVAMTFEGKSTGLFYGYVAEGIFNNESDFYQKNKNGDLLLDRNNDPIPVALPLDSNGDPMDISVNSIWVGDYKWKNVYDDPVKQGMTLEEISELDINNITVKDRTYIGNPHPEFSFGFTNTFKYKNLDLTLDLVGVYGNDIYNRLRQEYEMTSGNFGLLRAVRDYARIGVYDSELENADQLISNVYVINNGTDICRITNYDTNENNRVSSRFVEDGSYLRIKNVSLGYNLPNRFSQRFKIENLRVYVNIQNVYTFTNYSGFDPEVVGGSVLASSIDYGRYPLPRIYTMGLNLTF